MKKLFSALLATVMVCALSVNAFTEAGVAPAQDHAGHLYNVTTADKQWDDFASKSQMLEATRISDGVLKGLSTERLVEAVLSYPLLVNIYAYDSYQQGLKALAKDSDAFRELLKRADAGEKLLQQLNRNSMIMSEPSLESLTVSVLLSEESIWRTLENKETAKMALAASSTTVKTPKGTSVPVIIRGEELSLLQKSQMNSAFKDAYPYATFVSFRRIFPLCLRSFNDVEEVLTNQI
ncbi:hypothetical protein MO973_42390 [Paenibacillus sp. TRM 82003]|nr:hypothetical protein [Paenibacillus sp. TRM 82003]